MPYPEAMLTPDRLTHRSPKPLVFLLVAVFAAGVLVPSALAAPSKSAARAPSLRGLHPGETGPAVRKLQRMLSRLGYPVKVDGQFGPHTATMVRTLRADAGLDRSARVTQRFLRVLRRAQRGGPGDRRWLGIRRLRVGAQGKDVRLLQNALTKLGFPAATDGQFGPATRRSVRLFERAAGLRVDGVLTPRDVRTLKKAARSGGMAGAVSVDTTSQSAETARAPARRAGRPARRPTSRPGRSHRPRRPPATIGADGLAAAPAGAPAAVVAIIQAGNVIAHMPYRFGGGHQSWTDTGYDCSGSVSFALHGAGLLDTPLASYDFYTWGEAGPGQWVTIYAKDSHAYMVVAGLRYDTAASKGGGSRWTTAGRPPAGYVARHPAGPLKVLSACAAGPTASVSARSSAKRSRSTPSPRVSRSTDAMRTIAADSCSGDQRADWRESLRATNSLRRPSSRAWVDRRRVPGDRRSPGAHRSLGDEVDRLSHFSVADQRSTGEMTESAISRCASCCP